MPDQERKNLPSASSMPRYMACEGAWMAEKDIPAQDTKDSIAGTERHELMETDATEFDSQSDEFAVTRARDLLDTAILESMLRDNNLTVDDLADERETRIFMSDDNFTDIFSGMPDRVFVSQTISKALVADYKMLFGNHTEAKKNWQLISLAVLVHIKFRVDEVDVALIQPNLPNPSALTMCHFDKKALTKAKKLITERLELITLDGYAAPRTVNPHCNFCKARMTSACPQSSEFALKATRITEQLGTTTTVELLDKISLAKKLITDFEKAEKVKAVAQLTADPESLPGYKLATKNTTTLDTKEAWGKLLQVMDANDVVPAMKLSVPQLVKPYQASKTDKTSLGDCRKELNELLESCTTTEEGEPFIKKG